MSGLSSNDEDHPYLKLFAVVVAITVPSHVYLGERDPLFLATATISPFILSALCERAQKPNLAFFVALLVPMIILLARASAHLNSQ